MLDLLKLSDETDLDILNRSMEVMVEAFQTELLPVAAQLTARLVSANSHPSATLGLRSVGCAVRLVFASREGKRRSGGNR